MLEISDELKEFLKKENVYQNTARKLILEFYDGNVPGEGNNVSPVYTITNNQISSESLVITESLNDGDNLVFGKCNASQFEITVGDVLIDLTGKEFRATVRIDSFVIPLGIYRVESFVRQSDRRKKKITAYDRMRKFDVDLSAWYNALTFPMTLKQFRDALFEKVGIPQEDVVLPMDDMTVTKTIDPQKLSGIDVIEAICEINGFFGHIGRTGIFRYVYLKPASLYPADDLFPDEDLYPRGLGGEENTEFITKYKSRDTTYEDFSTQYIERVQIRQQEGDIGAIYGDEGGNTYVVEGNFLVFGKTSDELLQIAAEIYDRVRFISYRPCHIVCPALLWVEPGDGLICYTTDDAIEAYCLKRTLKGIQGMIDTIDAEGAIETEENFGVHSQIIQLEGKSLILKKTIDELSANMADLKKNTESSFTMTAEQIAAEVKRAKESEAALSLKADGISTSVTNLANNTTSSITQLSNKIDLKVGIGEISSRISVETGGVSIKSNRFSWESTNSSLSADGTLKCKNGEFSGKITSNTATIGGGTIGGFTIKGNELVSVYDNARVDFGTCYIDKYGMEVKEVMIEEDGIYPGSIARYLPYHMWESDTGNIYANDIYLDGSWWDGWSVMDTVKSLWDYTHGGGWNPCPNDSGGGCACDNDYGNCECGCDGGEELIDDIGAGCGGCSCDNDHGCSCDSNYGCACDNDGCDACGPGDGMGCSDGGVICSKGQ